MVVTEIAECSSSRSKVFIDYEFAFVLYKGELRLYHLKEGEEIREEDYRKIVEEMLPKRARLRCLNLLKHRQYTEKELLDKLQQGGYSQEISQNALSYVKSYGYVDDEQYARDYMNYRMNTRSKNRIRSDLWKKGISFAVTDAIWEEEAGEEAEQIEMRQLLQWLEKKNYDKNTADLREKRKTFSFLYGKGFGMEMIKRALSLE